MKANKDRMIHVPAHLLARVRSRERTVRLPGGYQRPEGAARVIERALDIEDLARSGVLGGEVVACWKHEGGMETFSTWEELIAHVRAEHPGIIKGTWKK